MSEIDLGRKLSWFSVVVLLCWAGMANVVLADAAVSGIVWLDSNQNGKQDSDEDGEPFVTVELYAAGSSSAMMVVQTDFEGHYSFGDVVAGDYTVNVILSDYELGYTIPNRGDDDTIDSDVEQSGRSGVFIVGTEPVMIDAGFIKILDVISPVQGVVWTDLDNDGRRDETEPLNGNITVTLYFSGTSQLFFIQETTTDENGAYELPGISQGDYIIEFALPDGFTQFAVQDVGDDTADSDVSVSSGQTPIFFHDGVVRDTQFDAGLAGEATALSVTLLSTQIDISHSVTIALLICLLAGSYLLITINVSNRGALKT